MTAISKLVLHHKLTILHGFLSIFFIGYVTTNVRYVTLVEDSIVPENVQLQTSRDNEICVLMVRLSNQEPNPETR